MDQHLDFPGKFSMEEAMRLANSPEGQKVLAQLQQHHSMALQSAMAQAQSGDYSQIKNTLSAFLQSPEGKQLMNQLRGNQNG